MNLKNIFLEITNNLDELDKDREKLLKIQRVIVRDCSIAIKSIHRKEFANYSNKIEEIKVNLENMSSVVNKNPGIFFNYLKTPEQEYSEAVCFYSIVNNLDLPSPVELNINQLNYALGLADVLGELRRYALDNIRNSQLEELNLVLEIMDEIYTYLFSLDYPSGLTKELRHKIDVGRNIIERTRADVSLTVRMNELKKSINDKLKNQQ